MTFALSEPIEKEIRRQKAEPIEKESRPPRADSVISRTNVLVVGSGYGAAVTALRLAGDGRRVVVLERGREYALGEFPNDIGQLPGHLRLTRHNADRITGDPGALFDLRLGSEVDVLVGSGLGGTSLINANVAVKPDARVFGHPAWPAPIRTNPAVLDEGYDEVSRLLGVGLSPRCSSVGDHPRKYAALERLGGALQSPAEPAPVTVTFPRIGETPPSPVKNAVGVSQWTCSSCGNCVTGCNVGAKNTLAMNLIPLAKTRGAEFFTGATVLTVLRAPDDPRKWHVRFRRTASEKTPLEIETFVFEADIVVLAAGSLGSTEILLRSRANDLPLSPMLGSCFSTNGDGLAMSFAQRDEVDTLGTANQEQPADIGPTISGMIRTAYTDPETGAKSYLTIEDGAVPNTIRGIFAELVTTGAQLGRIGNKTMSEWFVEERNQGRSHDPLAASDEAIKRSQSLLVMGDDGAQGRLELRYVSNDPQRHEHDAARVAVVWPHAARNSALAAADALLSSQGLKAGFDGGQYVPNPAWQPLPADVAQALGMGTSAGRVITVHPLGGCSMGDDSFKGVVNHVGAVYSGIGRPDALHAGLFVLDGAILPTAVGINPFLTIAALAWRGAGAILATSGWPESRSMTVGRQWATPARVPPTPVATTSLAITLREQMFGQLHGVPWWLLKINPDFADWGKFQGLVIQISMAVPNFNQWLSSPGTDALHAQIDMFCNPILGEAAKAMAAESVPIEHLLGAKTLLTGTGEVTLLAPYPAGGPLRKLWRTMLALSAYCQRREALWKIALRGIAEMLSGTYKGPGVRQALRAFHALAQQHSEYRAMGYKFTLGTGEGDREWVLCGQKIIAWSPCRPRLWDSLMNLPFELRKMSTGKTARGELKVDLLQMMAPLAPRVDSSPSLPASLEGLSRFGMFFARCLLQSSLWEFAAPTYPARPIERSPQPRPLKVTDAAGRPIVVMPETAMLKAALNSGAHKTCGGEAQTVQLRLTRYRNTDGAGKSARPVLLVHGLAQGSLIFCTDTLAENMAAAMWNTGFDVWLLDYRISNLFPLPSTSGWGIEDIARYDLPVAVDHVYEVSGRQPVALFAHCVGSTAVTMGILRGWLTKDRIRAVALNAIHPWIKPSITNRMRGKFGSLLRKIIGVDALNPIPSPDPSMLQMLTDRLAFSLARYGEGEEQAHSTRDDPANAICDRMTLLYGRMWKHKNLDPRTHAQFADLVGLAPLEVYRQLYYLTTLKRVVDAEGRNRFLRTGNVKRHWTIPTAFFHGNDSEVFNPYSATESAANLHAVLDAARGGPGTPIFSKRVDDLGHMDIVFSVPAREKVFPLLTEFFDRASSPARLLDRDFCSKFDPYDADAPHAFGLNRRLATGPILRAAWKEGNEIWLRYWLEFRDDITDPAAKLRIVANGAAQCSEHVIPRCDRTFRLVDIALRSDITGNITVEVVSGTTDPVLKGLPKTVVDKWEISSDAPWLKRLREDTSGTAFRFLVCSCRYPGTVFDKDLADKVFKGMQKHVGDCGAAPGVDMAFFLGDQIYADATAGMLDSDSWRERYYWRYREAFGSKNFRSFAETVPIHFTVDDHEIEDNWSGDYLDRPANELAAVAWEMRQEQLRYARRAARGFQGSGRTAYPIPGGAARQGVHWYAMSHLGEVGCPAFVMDTRMSRELRVAGPATAEMIGRDQAVAFETWLDAQQSYAGPKFVFCGSVLVPAHRDIVAQPSTSRLEDGWFGYPESLAWLVESIVKRGISNIVFVAGDVHFSAAVSLCLHAKGYQPVRAWHIVSSGLYAPFPFANTPTYDYDWNAPVSCTIEGFPDITIDYQAGLLTTVASHFLRVDASQHGNNWVFSVQACGPDGHTLLPEGIPPQGFVSALNIWEACL